MYARVVTFPGLRDRTRNRGGSRFREKVLPVARAQAGFAGAYVLVDRRAGGRVLGITLWESEQAARAAGTALDPLLAEAVHEPGVPPPVAELYEVVEQG